MGSPERKADKILNKCLLNVGSSKPHVKIRCFFLSAIVACMLEVFLVAAKLCYNCVFELSLKTESAKTELRHPGWSLVLNKS